MVIRNKYSFTKKRWDVVGVVLRERAELDVTVKQTDLHYVASVSKQNHHRKKQTMNRNDVFMSML